MYCRKCGQPMADQGAFCANCGEPRMDPGDRPARKMDWKKLAVWSGVVVTVMVIVGVLLWNSSHRKVADDYFKAYEKCDVDLMYDISAEYWIDFNNSGFYDGYAKASIRESLEDAMEDWVEDYGGNIKIEYHILDERRATSEELKQLEKVIYNNYAYYVRDRDEFVISDAYVLDIAFTVKGDKGSGEYELTDGLLLIKEDGSWKVGKGWISCSFYDG